MHGNRGTTSESDLPEGERPAGSGKPSSVDQHGRMSPTSVKRKPFPWINTILAAAIAAVVGVVVNSLTEQGQETIMRNRPPFSSTVSYNWSGTQMWAMGSALDSADVKAFEEAYQRDGDVNDAVDIEQFMEEHNAVRMETLFNGDGRPIRQHTPVRLVLTGNRSSPVLIQGIRARITNRMSPLDGTLVWWPPEGEGEVVTVGLDLDSDQPMARNIRDGGLDLGEPYFNSKNVSLAQGERFEFIVKAFTDTCYCEWELVVDAVADEGQVELAIRDSGGNPFRTTALSESYSMPYIADYTNGPSMLVRQPSGWSPLGEWP